MRRSFVALAVVAAARQFSFAAPATFNVDSTNTSLTLSGTALGSPIQQQGNGSLRTNYTGTVVANFTGDAVQLDSAGTLTANNSGMWQPAPGGATGSGLANYGGRVTVLSFFPAFFAVRNLVVAPSSGTLALSNAGTFDSTGLNVTANSGTVDYNAAILSQMGSADLAGSTGANQTTAASTVVVTRAGNTATAVLTIPAAASFTITDPTLGSATLNFSGQIRATTTSIGGDANFDKSVNINDFALLAAHFGQPGNWFTGDFNGDQTVTINDFAVLASNFGQTAPAALPRGAAVPEPAAVGVAIATSLLARRRTHRIASK